MNALKIPLEPILDGKTKHAVSSQEFELGEFPREALKIPLEPILDGKTKHAVSSQEFELGEFPRE